MPHVHTNVRSINDAINMTNGFGFPIEATQDAVGCAQRNQTPSQPWRPRRSDRAASHLLWHAYINRRITEHGYHSPQAIRARALQDACNAMHLVSAAVFRQRRQQHLARARADVGEQLAQMIATSRNGRFDIDFTGDDLESLADDAHNYFHTDGSDNLGDAIGALAEAESIRLVWCGDCGQPVLDEHHEMALNESSDCRVCDSCRDDLVYCEDADGYFDGYDVVWAYTSTNGYGQPSDPEPFRHTRNLCAINTEYTNTDHEYATQRVIDRLGWTDYGDGYEPYRDDWEDDSDDYDDDHHGGYGVMANVHQYHQHPLRRTSWYFVEPTLSCRTNPALGVEIELYCEENVPEILDERELNWIVERDGSLDSGYGVEVVTPPLIRAQWDALIPGLFSALSDANALAYDATGGMYGLHVTVNRKYLTPLQEARLSLFLTAEENLAFVMAVAQRRGIYSAHVDIGSMPYYDQKVKNLGGVSYRFKETQGKVKRVPERIVGVGKMTPLNVKGELAEFRIFQGSINAGTFRKNLQFVWALMHWTRPECATGSSWRHEDFCRWLADHRKDYPELVAYLERDSYTVKSGRGAIPNTWRELLGKPAKRGTAPVYDATDVPDEV